MVSVTRALAALGTLATLALIAPTALHGQGVDHGVSAPLTGPVELVGRAGTGAQTFVPASITPPAPPWRGSAVLGTAAFVPSMAGVELAPGDTSAHHGNRAHHAAVGALIGGAVGLALGIAGDRPGLGRGEMRGGHFHNLWLITAPLGALVGALAGTLRQAD